MILKTGKSPQLQQLFSEISLTDLILEGAGQSSQILSFLKKNSQMRERLFSQTEENLKVIFFKSSCATLSIQVKDNIFQVWSLCGLVLHLDNGKTKSPQQARGA